MKVSSLEQLFKVAKELTKQSNIAGTDVFKKVHYYNAVPIVTNTGDVEWYSPIAFWQVYNQHVIQRVDKTILWVYKDFYEHLVKSKGGNIMYVEYKGRKIPFGKYVIWDDTRNVFLAFNDINALNEALRQYGYVKDHSAVRSGYYTQYGYFSNDILYDLYLRYRYPEVYSPTAQKIVSQHFKQYNANPEQFRRQLLQNTEVIREIEKRHVSYATKSAEEKIKQLEQEIAMLKSSINSGNRSLIPILNTLEKQYESMVELLKSMGKTIVEPQSSDIIQGIAKYVAPLISIIALFMVFSTIFKLMRGIRV